MTNKKIVLDMEWTYENDFEEWFKKQPIPKTNDNIPLNWFKSWAHTIWLEARKATIKEVHIILDKKANLTLKERIIRDMVVD